jgi:hypothetical protein
VPSWIAKFGIPDNVHQAAVMAEGRYPGTLRPESVRAVSLVVRAKIRARRLPAPPPAEPNLPRVQRYVTSLGAADAILTTHTPGPAAAASYIPRNLMFCPAIIWYETGYSTFTLRQASRRSWRIGQTRPVTVRFLCYENTAQAGCLKHLTYCYTSLESIK